ncbi:MAG: hypothetical protein DWQ06_04450 [Calditrichaeota bacterium]|nr:MAG: hypothetical protein DWQ06_04450 [Calditrichota bacterium]
MFFKVLFISLIFLISCGQDSTTPQGVAEKFIEEYFVYVDQEKALPFTMGLAKIKIEEQLKEVTKVRKRGEKLGVMLADVEFTFVKEMSVREGIKGFEYKLDIQGNEFSQKRNVLVSVSKENGKWLVSNFTE